MTRTNNNKTNATVNNNGKKKAKRPFYRKKRFWGILLLVLLMVGSGGNDGTEVKESQTVISKQVDEKQTTKEKDKNDTKEKKKEAKKKENKTTVKKTTKKKADKSKTKEKEDEKTLENFQRNLDKTNAKLIKKEIGEFLYIEIGDGEAEKEIGKTKIESVKLKNQKLSINLDTSEVNIEMLDDEATAMLVLGCVTEELLRHDEFDMYWDTVTVNFKEIGKVTYTEDDVEVNEAGGFRQFPIFEQFANGEVSFK